MKKLWEHLIRSDTLYVLRALDQMSLRRPSALSLRKAVW